MLVECRGVGEMTIFANHQHCDGRYSLPHPLIRFFQTSSTHRLSDPSRLQRAAPSAPLNGQSHSNLTTDSILLFPITKSHYGLNHLESHN